MGTTGAARRREHEVSGGLKQAVFNWPGAEVGVEHRNLLDSAVAANDESKVDLAADILTRGSANAVIEPSLLLGDDAPDFGRLEDTLELTAGGLIAVIGAGCMACRRRTQILISASASARSRRESRYEPDKDTWD